MSEDGERTEREEREERQATDDLLAGFDRPGRSPRAPVASLDGSPPRFPRASPHAPAGQADTVLVTRRRTVALWPWLLAVFAGSVGLGLAVLSLGLRSGAKSASDGGPSEAVSASVGVGASGSVGVGASGAGEAVASAPVSSASASVPGTAASSARRAVPASASAPSRAGPAGLPKKPEHRGDFVPSL